MYSLWYLEHVISCRRPTVNYHANWGVHHILKSKYFFKQVSIHLLLFVSTVTGQILLAQISSANKFDFALLLLVNLIHINVQSDLVGIMQTIVSTILYLCNIFRTNDCQKTNLKQFKYTKWRWLYVWERYFNIIATILTDSVTYNYEITWSYQFMEL